MVLSSVAARSMSSRVDDVHVQNLRRRNDNAKPVALP